MAKPGSTQAARIWQLVEKKVEKRPEAIVIYWNSRNVTGRQRIKGEWTRKPEDLEAEK